jgi:hypothetical protein
VKLTQIEGQPRLLFCSGCTREGIGGTTPYLSASTEEVRVPEEWYQTECGLEYCNTCAAKLVEEDPTRSRSQFYTDTAGTNIDPNI